MLVLDRMRIQGRRLTLFFGAFAMSVSKMLAFRCLSVRPHLRIAEQIFMIFDIDEFLQRLSIHSDIGYNSATVMDITYKDFGTFICFSRV
jgi:hypothetical protein